MEEESEGERRVTRGIFVGRRLEGWFFEAEKDLSSSGGYFGDAGI